MSRVAFPGTLSPMWYSSSERPLRARMAVDSSGVSATNTPCSTSGSRVSASDSRAAAAAAASEGAAPATPNRFAAMMLSRSAPGPASRDTAAAGDSGGTDAASCGAVTNSTVVARV